MAQSVRRFEAVVANATIGIIVCNRADNIVSANQLAHQQFGYAEGGEANRVYFVESGRVKTVRATAIGKELITNIYQAGEFFGYPALLEHTTQPESAVVMDEAVLLHIPVDEFNDLLLRNVKFSQQFIRLLAGRVRERKDQLTGMAYHSLRRRVAGALLQLHAQAAAAQPAAPLIHLSREDLAALIGTAPESLSRTLSEFRQDGLLELTPKTLQVLQPDKLRRNNW